MRKFKKKKTRELRNNKNVNNYECLLKRMLYCPGYGQELLSALGVSLVCHASNGSRIANHAWSNNHVIDFENALIIDKGTFRTRKTLEAWYTRVTPNANKNSCPLPRQ